MTTTQWILIGAGAYLLLKPSTATPPAPAGSTPYAPNDGGNQLQYGGQGPDPTTQLQQYGQTLLASAPGIISSIGGLFS